MEVSSSFADSLDMASERDVVCAGRIVDICFPLPSDYEFLITLRNRPDVRRWFIDDRVLDMAAATEWLASRSTRRDDVLLVVRHRARDLNIGSIGWTQLDSVKRTAELGRLAIDPSNLRRLARAGEKPSVLRGLALDACMALRDYAFSGLGLIALRTCYKVGNVASAGISETCGMVPGPPPEGSMEDMVYLQLTRERWEGLSPAAR